MIETFFRKLSKKGAFQRQRLKTYNFTVFQLIISFKKLPTWCWVFFFKKSRKWKEYTLNVTYRYMGLRRKCCFTTPQTFLSNIAPQRSRSLRLQWHRRAVNCHTAVGAAPCCCCVVHWAPCTCESSNSLPSITASKYWAAASFTLSAPSFPLLPRRNSACKVTRSRMRFL